MTKLTLSKPSVGEKNTVAEPKVNTALQVIETWANGEVGTNNIEAGSVTEAMLAAAVKTLLGKTVSGLTYKLSEASESISNGELFQANKAGSTITLPAVTANAMVTVFASANGVKVKGSGGAKIFGDSVEGVETVTLATYQHVTLVASGSVWMIVAGEPKPEQKYGVNHATTKAEAEAGIEISATRRAFVGVTKHAVNDLVIGGEAIANTGGETTPWFGVVGPGQKIVTHAAMEYQFYLF